MVEALKNNSDTEEHTKGPTMKKKCFNDYAKWYWTDYFHRNKNAFFGRFSINQEFFKENLAILKVFCLLNVVNDTAERRVKLMKDYNSIPTKDEQQEQVVQN